MSESPQLREEKGLERRGWLGCLLTFVLAGIAIAVMTALPDVFFNLRSPQSTPLLVVSALVVILLTALLGITAVLLIARLTVWSAEGERRRHQRSTAVLKQALPGLVSETETSRVTRLSSSREQAKFLLLLLACVVAFSLAVLVVGTIVNLVLPGVPGMVSSVLTIALCLGILYLGDRAIMRSRGKSGAAAASPAKSQVQERSRPGRSRMAGAVLYFILTLVPLIGVVSLIARLPAPPLLMPILVLAACAVIFTAMSVIYIIVPFLWIASAVGRCEYDNAMSRARLIEKLSILPGFYLNLHGVILLWASRYEEARQTFEQSIGEQRKETMGAGSAALENIGCALAWQGKYDEAIKMFEGSISISAEQAMVYSDLAEALLYQGADLPRALELTERAWKNYQASFEARWLSRYQAGQISAVRAWALARLGRYQEAEETLARAFGVADRSFKPVLAGINLRAGYVALVRADNQRAKEYFAQGQQLDPNGHYGRRCLQAMQGEE